MDSAQKEVRPTVFTSSLNQTKLEGLIMPEDSLVQETYNQLDRFLTLADESTQSHPFAVVTTMHEYFRSLYPYDPFITDRYSDDYLENIHLCLEACICMLESAKKMGDYFQGGSDLKEYMSRFEQEKKDKTQTLFGKLWKARRAKKVLDSANILKESFERNNFDVSFFKGKKIIDMGCGSGRFTLALAQLGAAHVTGVDLGGEGIAIGEQMAKETGITNVTFEKVSVLDLPFEDETFDFVFCKGVLHHTGNLNKGLDEYHRIMKKGGQGFLYLYGSGGIFWNSRRKMREVMQKIPVDYTIKVLDLIGMPARRTIFVDSWYVPIEDHVKSAELEPYLKKLGFSKIERWKKGREIELESVVFSGTPNAEVIWGEGELRYTLAK